MSNTRDKILTSATECFFQHGYSATNISMISRYIKISRVTIHKQFTSKEILFRAVLEKYMADKGDNLAHYIKSSGDFWQETETFIIDRCRGLFEEISSALVRADLVHAGQTYCQDLIKENEIKVRESIHCRIKIEIEASRLTLQKINISSEELSRVIESASIGLAVSNLSNDTPTVVRNLINVFKASTSI